jgi:hypothetical protein
MAEQDTVRLLRECDAGIRMGIEAIDDVLPHVGSDTFKSTLSESRSKHMELKQTIGKTLIDYQDEGKEPSKFAEIMSQIKTGFKMMVKPTDNAIADLITDGGNMGTKSLNRYLNQYQAADEKSRDIAKKLISLEDKLVFDTRKFL